MTTEERLQALVRETADKLYESRQQRDTLLAACEEVQLLVLQSNPAGAWIRLTNAIDQARAAIAQVRQEPTP